MPDFDVRLGDFTFERFEVPDVIGFGGEQALSTHKLIGGKRVIDAMGRDDRPLDWSGRFTGPDALDRARQLEAMRIAGKAAELSWSELRYSVLIKRFEPNFEKAFLIPYSISCEVVSDLASPLDQGDDDGLDEVVGGDLGDLSGLSDGIGDAGLSGLVGQARAAVTAVTTLAGASQATLGAVLSPLALSTDRLSILVTGLEGAAAGPVGGGGLSVGQTAAALLSQADALNGLVPLYSAQALVGRVTTNLESASTAGASVVVGGGDLYRLAASTYGDEGQWPLLARANGLTDPFLSGVNTLTIPPASPPLDGVLQA